MLWIIEIIVESKVSLFKLPKNNLNHLKIIYILSSGDRFVEINSLKQIIWAEADRVLYALSHTVLNLLNAHLLPLMSFLCLCLNSLTKWSTILLSKSSPPKWVSTLVDLTSNLPCNVNNNQMKSHSRTLNVLK